MPTPVLLLRSVASAPAVAALPLVKSHPALFRGPVSRAQAEAGNYAKRRVPWNGLTLVVENEAGSIRTGRGWQTRMLFPYGYVAGSEGTDGDEVDCYLGPYLEDAPFVYVVHQRRHGAWHEFDEDKVMLGFLSEEEAAQAYLAHYDDARFLGPITVMPVGEFVAKVRATAEAPGMLKSWLGLPDLLKATLKKMVTVPGYTKADGTVVPPHQKMVHYNPDHTFEGIAGGGMSHSQKLAHKKLSGESWFHALPNDEKAIHVMAHATDLQDQASASAAISGWKAAAKTGKNPTAAQWKAFHALPAEKQGALYDEVQQATGGKLAHLKKPEQEPENVTPDEAAAGDSFNQLADGSDAYAHEAQDEAEPSHQDEQNILNLKHEADSDFHEGNHIGLGVLADEATHGYPEVAAHAQKHLANLKAKDALEALPTTGSHYQKEALKKLQADPSFKMKSHADQHEAVLSLYKQLQGAASQAAAVSMWKKAMLAGKVPSPAQHAAIVALEGSDPAKAMKLKLEVVQAIGPEKADQLYEAAGGKPKDAAPTPAAEPKTDAVNKTAAQMGAKNAPIPDVSSAGPQEGDTKPGAVPGHTLVFKNGHWVLQDNGKKSVSAFAAQEWQNTAALFGMSPLSDAVKQAGGMLAAGNAQGVLDFANSLPPAKKKTKAALTAMATKYKALAVAEKEGANLDKLSEWFDSVSNAHEPAAAGWDAFDALSHTAKMHLFGALLGATPHTGKDDDAKAAFKKVQSIVKDHLNAGYKIPPGLAPASWSEQDANNPAKVKELWDDVTKEIQQNVVSEAYVDLAIDKQGYGSPALLKLAQEWKAKHGTAPAPAGSSAAAPGGDTPKPFVEHDGKVVQIKGKAAKVNGMNPAHAEQWVSAIIDGKSPPGDLPLFKLTAQKDVSDALIAANKAKWYGDKGKLELAVKKKSEALTALFGVHDALLGADGKFYPFALSAGVMVNADAAAIHKAAVLKHAGLLKQPRPPKVVSVTPAAAAAPAAPTGPMNKGAQVFHHTTDGHNKQWAVSTHGNELITSYGKIGGSQQKTTKVYASSIEALEAKAKLVQEKVGKGYYGAKTHVVHQHTSDGGGAYSPAAAAPAPVAPAAAGGYPPGISGVFKQSVDTMTAAMNSGNPGPIENELMKLSGSSMSSQAALNAKVFGIQALKFIGGAMPSFVDPADWGGPKDGDTKPAADGGTLVFKNGYWHKVAGQGTGPGGGIPLDDPGALVTAVAQNTEIAPANQKKWIEPALEHAKKGDAVALAALYLQLLHQKGGATTKKVVSTLLHTVTGGKEGKNHLPKTTSRAPKVASVTPMSSSAAAAPAVSPKGTTSVAAGAVKPGDPHKMDGWKQVGPQKGSNPGGSFTDKNGQTWYCKFPGSADIARNEVLASKLYAMLGFEVPFMKLVEKDGKVGIASKWNDGLKKGSASELAKADGMHEGFVVDAWLANWDVVGPDLTNTQITKDGKAHRVDVGGSLLYRAQGGKKTDFGDQVKELDSLLDGSKNGTAKAVFSGASKATLLKGVQKLNMLKDSQIEELVNLLGPGGAAEKKKLAATLIARRADILKKFGVEDQWTAVKKLDPTKLPVNPKDLPKPIDFENFNGPGKGLSSKAHLNKQNSIDSAALVAFAAKGNLTALKDYQYDAFDKESGKPLGKKPITEHPSNKVQEQWAGLVELLQSIYAPSLPTLDMPSLGAVGALDEISDFVGSFHPTERPETVATEHRMGFFMALNQIDDIQSLTKDLKWSFITKGGAWVKAMKTKFPSLSALTRSYIGSVQDSGSINHVWSQGKQTAAGVSVHKLAHEIYKNAVDVPEGTVLRRGMTDTTAGKAMMKQLLNAKPGLVIQNTDSMCTSFNEDHSWGGDVQMTIRCAKGCKATPSFASGAFSSEYEITTLPGQRFVVLGTKKKPSGGIELDVLMLPPHEGYVANLAKLSGLAKALQSGFMLFFRRAA